METYNLQQRRYASAKRMVYSELVNYFVNLDDQRKLWYFSLAIRHHSQNLHFTVEQAEKLAEHLVVHFGIRMANVESALEFRAYGYKKANNGQNIIRFVKPSVSEDQFKMQIDTLYNLLQNKTIEFQQALEMVISILNYYPSTNRVFGRHQSQSHTRESQTFAQAIHL